MIRTLTALALLSCASAALAQASAAIASGKVAPSALSPGEIVADAPKAEWVAIAPSDLLVMDLAPDANAKPRRVVIQLMPPPFSQPWITWLAPSATGKVCPESQEASNSSPVEKLTPT